MFFKSPEQKKEEYIYDQLRLSVYKLTSLVYDIGLKHAVRKGDRLFFVDPWKNDMDMLSEINDALNKYSRREFI